jgi:hypothetical protein
VVAAAHNILAQRDQWVGYVMPTIERHRRKGKEAITAASSIEEIAGIVTTYCNSLRSV